MLDKVITFLTGIGITDIDESLLGLIMDNVVQQIKNETNQPEVPEGLVSVAVNMTAGQYLRFKKAAGNLPGFDFEAAVKQIQMGDTSTSFAESITPEQRLDGLIASLVNSGESQFAAYRRIQW